MPISYIYAKDRRTSLIGGEDNAQFEPSGKPAAGYTAETRFFAAPFSVIPKFVVKCPKYSGFYSRYSQPSIIEKNAIDVRLKSAYERERDLWNLFYPEKTAVLFSNGGLRLVLPYLPYKTLRQIDIPDRLSRCQIALAIAYAFKKLYALKLYYNDLNEDNILIEKRAGNIFKAHLIDFGGVGEVSYNQEQSYLIHFISNLSLKQNRPYESYDVIDNIIQDLLCEINMLSPKIDRIFRAGGQALFSRYVDGLREEANFSSWWYLNE